MEKNTGKIYLNLGCGNTYKRAWINVDCNKDVKADIYADFTKKLPFKNNSVDVVLLDHVLEHIPSDKYFGFIDELYRICKSNAKIEIYVPHYSGMYALKHPTHYKYFGIGSMDLFRPEPVFNGERYCKARFELLEEKLIFWHHNLVNFNFLSKIPLNWLFNFSRGWQLLMEKFHIWGFDEIKFVLEVKKC